MGIHSPLFPNERNMEREKFLGEVTITIQFFVPNINLFPLTCCMTRFFAVIVERIFHFKAVYTMYSLRYIRYLSKSVDGSPLVCF